MPTRIFHLTHWGKRFQFMKLNPFQSEPLKPRFLLIYWGVGQILQQNTASSHPGVTGRYGNCKLVSEQAYQMKVLCEAGWEVPGSLNLIANYTPWQLPYTSTNNVVFLGFWKCCKTNLILFIVADGIIKIFRKTYGKESWLFK